MEQEQTFQPGGEGRMPQPDNYLVWAILCTVCCCLPFGIVSIVYAAKVNGLYACGNYAEAELASANAKKWAVIGAVTGAIVNIIVGILNALGAFASGLFA